MFLCLILSIQLPIPRLTEQDPSLLPPIMNPRGKTHLHGTPEFDELAHGSRAWAATKSGATDPAERAKAAC